MVDGCFSKVHGRDKCKKHWGIEYRREYNKRPDVIKRHALFNATPRQRANRARYEQTEKCRRYRAEYAKSEKNLAYVARIRQTEEHKAYMRQYRKKYLTTAKGKMASRAFAKSEAGKEYYKNYRRWWFKSPKGKAALKNQAHRRRLHRRKSDINGGWLLKLRLETTHCSICRLPLCGIVHLDHILPLCAGGLHMKNNVRYVHQLCNVRRPKDGSDLGSLCS